MLTEKLIFQHSYVAIPEESISFLKKFPILMQNQNSLPSPQFLISVLLNSSVFGGGILNRVVRWKSTNLSEKYVILIFRVEEQAKQETSLM
jgi:hypothetical protein